MYPSNHCFRNDPDSLSSEHSTKPSKHLLVKSARRCQNRTYIINEG